MLPGCLKFVDVDRVAGVGGEGMARVCGRGFAIAGVGEVRV